MIAVVCVGWLGVDPGMGLEALGCHGLGRIAQRVGQGRHVHTSLILHHQMEHLVPGAFRLMANLVDRRA